MPYYIYILTDNFNSVLYIGVTNNLARRIGEHRAEQVEGFTKRYHLHKLVYFEEWDDINQAIHREKQLKGWRREKKERLIHTLNPKWEELMPFPDT